MPDVDVFATLPRLPTASWSVYLSDWRDRYRGVPAEIFVPQTVLQIQVLVREAAARNIGLVIQGGNTGNCAAAIPDESGRQWLILMKDLKSIRDVSSVRNTVTVDAGVTLAEVQRVAADVGRLFPLSLGSEGQCQIGGNLATNAGGHHVLRYGTMRDLCLGLEVVTADGHLCHAGFTGLRKDTSGFDLKHYFIGAEGKLGIITGACLRLFPRPKQVHTLWFGCASLEEALQCLHQWQSQLGDRVCCFEVMHEDCLTVIQDEPPVRAPWMVLCEIESFVVQDVADFLVLRAVWEHPCLWARHERDRQAFWRVREAIPFNQPRNIKHDIALPVDQIQVFVDDCVSALRALYSDVPIFMFGHLGDGNLHFNVVADMQEEDRVHQIVYDRVLAYGGTIAAEHGVGRLKRKAFEQYASDVQKQWMKTIKHAFDPLDLFQRGV